MEESEAAVFQEERVVPDSRLQQPTVTQPVEPRRLLANPHPRAKTLHPHLPQQRLLVHSPASRLLKEINQAPVHSQILAHVPKHIIQRSMDCGLSEKPIKDFDKEDKRGEEGVVLEFEGEVGGQGKGLCEELCEGDDVEDKGDEGG
jgi:hypothetical protein